MYVTAMFIQQMVHKKSILIKCYKNVGIGMSVSIMPINENTNFRCMATSLWHLQIHRNLMHLGWGKRVISTECQIFFRDYTALKRYSLSGLRLTIQLHVDRVHIFGVAIFNPVGEALQNPRGNIHFIYTLIVIISRRKSRERKQQFN